MLKGFLEYWNQLIKHTEEILAVPDNLLSNAETLSLIRSNIQEARRIRGVRRLDLNEDTPVSRTAARVHTFAMSFFRFQ